MKILILNKNDIKGGAAVAAYRLHRGLLDSGCDAKMVVQKKTTHDASVFGPGNRVQSALNVLRPHLDALPLRLYGKREENSFYLQWVPGNVVSRLKAFNPDIVHLHWICGGCLPIGDLAKISAPIVWTIHDMWGFTGGCSYSGNCTRYTEQCGKCPQLKSNNKSDLSRIFWRWKNRIWEKTPMAIVSPSNWLAQSARRSALFGKKPVHVIPNGINTDRFKPIEKSIARDILNLPQNKKLILFGAMAATSNPRKGFQYLCSALNSMNTEDFELVVFGADQPDHPVALALPTHYMGVLSDEISLALLYSAVDVFVLPSTEDNLPNTIMEALACGTPCVAFNIGGMPDMIDHLENGYLARPIETKDLVYGIRMILEADPENGKKMSENARQKVLREFDIQIIAERYKKLYEEVVC